MICIYYSNTPQEWEYAHQYIIIRRSSSMGTSESELSSRIDMMVWDNIDEYTETISLACAVL